MKVSIENLGVVKHADIEIGDLTIIAGENSTGKTKLVYAIWDIIRRTEEYFKYDESFFKNKSYSSEYTFNELGLNNDVLPFEMRDQFDVTVNIAQTLSESINFHRIHNEKVNSLKVNITKPTIIINTKESAVGLSFDDNTDNIYIDDDEYMSFEYLTNCQVFLNFDDDKVFISNVEISYELRDEYDDEQISIYNRMEEYIDDKNRDIKSLDIFEEYEDLILDTIYNAINSTIGNDNTIEIATSERSGVISFLSDYQKITNKNDLFDNPALTYNVPVSTNIDFISGLSVLVNNRKKISEMRSDNNLQENTLLMPVYEEIEKMIGGSLLVNQWGAIYFNRYDKEENEEAIHFNNLSSSIKNLTMIYFQLKYSETFATIDDNTYYVIDEPEAFLHPMNQIKMARVLAMLVNHGVKVIVTTHSEYLIRELNVLIALGSNDIQPENYKGFSVLNDVKENMTLNVNKKDVNIYTLNLDGRTEKQIVNPKGMTFHGFDSALESQAKILGAVKELAKKVKHLDSEDNLKGKE